MATLTIGTPQFMGSVPAQPRPASAAFVKVGSSTILSTTTQTGAVQVPHWAEYPELWDTVRLDGIPLPGLCELQGEGFQQKVQRAKSQGKHGSKHRYLGTSDVDFRITVRLWTEQDLAKFAEILARIINAPVPTKTRKVTSKVVTTPVRYTRVVQRPEGGSVSFTRIEEEDELVTQVEYLESSGPKTLDVYHPALEMFGIRTATLLKVSLPHRADKDVYEVQLQMAQLVLGQRDCGTGEKTGSSGSLIVDRFGSSAPKYQASAAATGP